MAETVEKSGFIKGENEMVNVFQWVDHVTKDKKVTVVMTLPSVVNKKDCEINLTSGDESGVSTEVVIKVPWSSRFVMVKVFFGVSILIRRLLYILRPLLMRIPLTCLGLKTVAFPRSFILCIFLFLSRPTL